MPELPEVETSKRYIEQFLLNAKILNIQSRVSKLRWQIHPDIKFFFNNTIILKIDRIGKYILINTSNKNTLILHLGMSGYLSINEVNFKKIKHESQMYSLANAFDNNDIKEFIKRSVKFLKLDNEDDFQYICEPKIDGLSLLNNQIN